MKWSRDLLVSKMPCIVTSDKATVFRFNTNTDVPGVINLRCLITTEMLCYEQDFNFDTDRVTDCKL